MKPLAAFLRLAFRPLFILMWLWIAFMAAAPANLWQLMEEPIPLLQLHDASQLSQASMVAIWRMAVTLPVATGLIMWLLLQMIRQGAYVWTVPAMRRSLGLGTGLLAAIAALPMSVLLLRLHQAGPAFVAFGLSGSICVAVASPYKVGGRVRLIWPGLALGALAFALADWLYRTSQTRPVPLVLLLLAAATVSLVVTHSTEGGRMAFGLNAEFWENARSGATHRTGWRRPLWRDHMVDWIFAGNHVVYGRLRAGYVGSLVVMASVIVVFSRLLSAQIGHDIDMTWLAVVPLLNTPLIPKDLSAPLSRRRRALIAYASSLAFLVITGIYAILLWWVVKSTGLIESGFIPLNGLVIITFLLTWAPVVQWSRVRLGTLRAQTRPLGAGAVDFLMAAVVYPLVVFGSLTAIAILHVFGTGMGRVLGTIVLAATVQAGYWLAIKRYFAREDLK